MAKKITELTELAAQPATGDLFIVEDVSASTTKKITWDNLVADGSITPAKLEAGTGADWAWQDWTPTYANITVNNGTVVAKYIQIGKKVYGEWRLVCGSSTAIGNGATVSVPVTPASRYGLTNSLLPVGQLIANDINSTATRGLLALYQSTTVLSIFYASSNVITSTNPITEATGDIWFGRFEYEAA